MKILKEGKLPAMKKVCFVTGHLHYQTGGAEVQSMRIASKLRQWGYEVCYLNTPIRDRDNFSEMEIIDEIEVYNYRCYERFRLFDFFKIKRLFTRINADVYYLRACPFIEGFVAFFAKRQGAKVVWQCASGRSLIKFYKTKNLFRSGRPLSILVNAFNAICHDYLRLYAISNSSCIVAQVENNRLTLHETFNKQSTLIRKGIHMHKTDTQKNESEINIVFLRNIRAGVRHELFLELAKKFKNTTCMHFKVIGRMSPINEKVLNRFNESGVKYLGFLENKQVLEILGKTHILIDTLEEPQGQTVFSTAFLEAWSRNVAVLSFGSNPDNVFEKHNVGYFVKSVDDCVEKIKYFARHRDVLRKIGSDARDYVLNNHSLDTEVEQLATLL